MAETTWTIKFEDEGDKAPPPPSAPPPSGKFEDVHQPTQFAFPSARAADPSKPAFVALTKENADLVAAALKGKIVDPGEFEKQVRATAPPPVTPTVDPFAPFDFTPERQKSVFKADGTFDFSPVDKVVKPPQPQSTDTFDFSIPRANQLANRIVTPKPVVPEGGDAGLQDAMNRQHAKEVMAEKAKATKAGGSESGLGDLLRMIPGGSNLAGLAKGVGLEGALGGVGGAAGLGGHLAAAYALQTVAEKVIAFPYEKARQGIEAVANAGTALARNDFGGLAKQAADGFANIAERTGLAGKIVAEEIRTYAAAGEAVAQVTRALIDRGRELSRYDANLAYATATADVRKLQADIREANRTGQQVGRLIDAQSRLETALQDAFAPIKGKIADQLADVVERLAFFVEIFDRGLQVVESVDVGVEKTYRLLRELAKYSPILDKLAGNVEAAAAQEQQRRRDQGAIGLQEWFALANGLNLSAPPRDEREEDARQKLAFPLLR